MPFGGVVVNRVHHDRPGGDADLDDVAGELAAELGAKLAGRVAENLGDYHVLAAPRPREHRAPAPRARRRGAHRSLVPHLDGDVHDVEGLPAIQRYLFATEAQRTAMLVDVVA